MYKRQPQSIISDGIFIQNAEFYVTGSEPLAGGTTAVDQAVITIFIEAAENNNDPNAEVYRVQTSVTQRTIDI